MYVLLSTRMGMLEVVEVESCAIGMPCVTPISTSPCMPV
jgi:hypothetical protein